MCLAAAAAERAATRAAAAGFIPPLFAERPPRPRLLHVLFLRRLAVLTRFPADCFRRVFFTITECIHYDVIIVPAERSDASAVGGRYPRRLFSTGFLYHIHYDNKTVRVYTKCIITVFICGRCDDGCDGWSDDGPQRRCVI